MLGRIRGLFSKKSREDELEERLALLAGQSAAWQESLDAHLAGAAACADSIAEAVGAAELRMQMLLRWGEAEHIPVFLEYASLRVQRVARRWRLHRQLAGLCTVHKRQCEEEAKEVRSVLTALVSSAQGRGETVELGPPRCAMGPPAEILKGEASVHSLRLALRRCEESLEATAAAARAATDAMARLSAADRGRRIVTAAEHVAMRASSSRTVGFAMTPPPDTPADAPAPQKVTLTDAERDTVQAAARYICLLRDPVVRAAVTTRAPLTGRLYLAPPFQGGREDAHISSASTWLTPSPRPLPPDATEADCCPDFVALVQGGAAAEAAPPSPLPLPLRAAALQPIDLQPTPVSPELSRHAASSVAWLWMQPPGSGQPHHCVRLLLSPAHQNTLTEHWHAVGRHHSVFLDTVGDSRVHHGKLVAAWCMRNLGFDPLNAVRWAHVQGTLRRAATSVKAPAPPLQPPSVAACPQEQGGAAAAPPATPAATASTGTVASPPVPPTTSASPQVTPPSLRSRPASRSVSGGSGSSLLQRLRRGKSGSSTSVTEQAHADAVSEGLTPPQVGDSNFRPRFPRPHLVNDFAKWFAREIAKEVEPALLQRGRTLSQSASAAADTASPSTPDGPTRRSSSRVAGAPDTLTWWRTHALPMVRRLLYTRLHALTFGVGRAVWAPPAVGGAARILRQDARWRRKAPAVALLPLHALNISEKVLPRSEVSDPALLAVPRALLGTLETLMTPDSMLHCLRTAVDFMLLELRLRRGGANVQVAADDLIPLLIGTLARSSMSQPHAALAFMANFGMGGDAAADTGSVGFLLAVFQTALMQVCQWRVASASSTPGPAGSPEPPTPTVDASPLGRPSDTSVVPDDAAVVGDGARGRGSTGDAVELDGVLRKLDSGRASSTPILGGAGGDTAASGPVTEWVDSAGDSEGEEGGDGGDLGDTFGMDMVGSASDAHAADRAGRQEMTEWILDHKVVQETLALFS